MCLKCLLDSGVAGAGQSLAERIFQAALSLGAGERAAFVANAASGDAAVLEEVRMLLQGYEEAGGDAAQATLGGTAHERWAGVRREEPGTVIDHFRLVKIIGEGGMGSVWEAEQTEPIKRRVALKIIKLGMDTEEVVRRFERERRTLARMTHPHIAQVHEAGATPAGRPYFAMELVEGTAITTHCMEQGLSVRERLALFLDVCAAVEHAHQKGVIHRDLKPSNILVAGGAVKVIDFGVAKATLDDGGDGLLTKQAQVLGTPAYMSPEQAESNGTDVDTRTDVYSLGAVLYELLSGALPFDPRRLASTHLREVQRILREEVPPRPSTRLGHASGKDRPYVTHEPHRTDETRRSELSGDLDWITMKALSKERERRYPSAAAFAEDVRRFLQGAPVSAVPPTLAYRAGKFVRRHKAGVAAAAVILAALAGGLVVSLIQVHRTNEALAGEAKARALATFTVADMHTSSGLTAAENGDPSRAALWFTRAAQIAADDPDRARTNRLRAETWTNEYSEPVAAFETGLPHIECIAFHPDGSAVLLTEVEAGRAQVWQLDTDQPWAPAAQAGGGAWSPDGRRIALSLPGKIKVLAYPSGEVLAEREAQGTEELAFNPSGEILATGTSPPLLWHWKSGVSQPSGAGNDARRIRWSPDGRLILWQSGGTVVITTAEQPDRALFPPVPNYGKTLCDFTADSARFFHTDQDRSLLRDARTGAVQQEISGGGYATAVSASGRQLTRSAAPLWDAEKERRTPQHSNHSVMECAQFSPDGRFLATCSYDATVRLWNAGRDQPLGTVGWHQHPVQCVAWSPDGTRLASSQIGLVRVWRVSGSGLTTSIPTGAGSLAALSADGWFVAASGVTQRGGTLSRTRVHEVSTGQPASAEIEAGGIITDAVFSPDGAQLALAVSTTPQRQDHDWKTGGSGHLALHDAKTGARLAGPIALPSEPRGIAMHSSGEFIACYCGGGEGVEWNRATGTLHTLFTSSKASLPQHTLNNGRIAYTADGRQLVAWGQLAAFHLFDRQTGRPLEAAPLPQGDAIFHGLAMHGSTLALAPIGPSAPQVMLLDAASGKQLSPPLRHADWIYHAAFDETGTLLLTTGRRPVAQVWDWRRGTVTGPALQHHSEVMAGVFLPGTPWVITGAQDGLVRFWDRRTGMMIRPPVALPGMVLQLLLTPDGRHLIAGGFLGYGELFVIDLQKALPAPAPAADAALEALRAEINAAATLHEGGGLVPLTAEAWLKKWRTLRAAGRK